MATLSERKRASGTAYVVYYYENGTRKAFSLDTKYSRRQASEIALRLQDVLDANKTGGKLDRPAQVWLDKMTDDLRGRFVKAGLIEKKNSFSIGELIQEYFKDNQNVFAAGTFNSKQTNLNRFMCFFGDNTPADDLTQESVEDYRDQLLDEYAQATVGGAVKTGHALFAWAVKKKMVEVNPFDGVSAPSMVNKEREHFVTREDYRKLLDACPNQTWRTLIALCRIGGLRNPSETIRVEWSDINWETGKMLVHSPKTKRYAGKEARVIPLYPELREELGKQFEQAEEGGSPFVIDRNRRSLGNMRICFLKIIFQAGLEEWPRLFHNLRGSRSCELFSEFPSHVASAWLGQSPTVAVKHYLHPTDDQYRKASSMASVNDEAHVLKVC